MRKQRPIKGYRRPSEWSDSPTAYKVYVIVNAVVFVAGGVLFLGLLGEGLERVGAYVLAGQTALFGLTILGVVPLIYEKIKSLIHRP